jgi:hypothetical protein
MMQSPLKKLIVTRLVKELPPFMEPEASLPCSQQPATGLYPEQDATRPQIPILFT